MFSIITRLGFSHNRAIHFSKDSIDTLSTIPVVLKS